MNAAAWLFHSPKRLAAVTVVVAAALGLAVAAAGTAAVRPGQGLPAPVAPASTTTTAPTVSPATAASMTPPATSSSPAGDAGETLNTAARRAVADTAAAFMRLWLAGHGTNDKPAWLDSLRPYVSGGALGAVALTDPDAIWEGTVGRVVVTGMPSPTVSYVRVGVDSPGIPTRVVRVTLEWEGDRWSVTSFEDAAR